MKAIIMFGYLRSGKLLLAIKERIRLGDSEMSAVIIDHYNFLLQVFPIDEIKHKSKLFAAIVDQWPPIQFTISIVIKQAPTEPETKEFCKVVPMYKNEINFYKNICPKLRAFEEQYQVIESFLPVAEYFMSDSEQDNEVLAIRDLGDGDFRDIDCRLDRLDDPLDEDHFRLVFRTYGYFHAISFCYKNQNPHEFYELVQPFNNILNKNIIVGYCKEIIINLVKKIVLNLDEPRNFKPQLELYLADATKIDDVIFNSVNFMGENGCLLHGNCNAVNTMFYYNGETKQVEAAKLLDFGFARYGSPVEDLSDFFYNTAKEAKWHLDNLTSYLDDYYESFSIAAIQFHENPQKLLSKQKLMEDWSKYSRFSIFMRMNKLNEKYSDETQLATKLFIIDASTLLQHMYNLNAL